MIEVILGELAVAFLACTLFVVVYWRPTSWRETPAGRHLMAMAVVLALEVGTLLLLGLGIQVPLPVFVLVFGALDAVLIQRLVLLWRARMRDGVHR